MQTLGNSVATFMAGIFLGISWHSAYLVYLIFVPVIFLFATSYTPRVEKAIKEEQQNS